MLLLTFLWARARTAPSARRAAAVVAMAAAAVVFAGAILAPVNNQVQGLRLKPAGSAHFNMEFRMYV